MNNEEQELNNITASVFKMYDNSKKGYPEKQTIIIYGIYKVVVLVARILIKKWTS